MSEQKEQTTSEVKTVPETTSDSVAVEAVKPTETETSEKELVQPSSIKLDSPEEKAAAKAQILKQVEFYFSDQNYPTDKFLWKTSQANDGWVPIAVIASFKRMRKYRPLEIVIEALKESEKLLEVSDDGELVRRKEPLIAPKKEETQSAFQRSIYAKGFGEETETSQVDIEKYFEQYGKINQVRLRRDNENNKKFKSSVFVEFSKKEDATKFLELDPKPKYNETELLIMSKPAYVEMKTAEHKFGNSNGNYKRPRQFNAFKEMDHQGNGNKRDNNKRGGRNQRGNNFRNKRQRTDRKPRNEEKKQEQENNTTAVENKTVAVETAAE